MRTQIRKRTYFATIIFFTVMLVLICRTIIRHNHVDFVFKLDEATVKKAYAEQIITPTPTPTQRDLIIEDIKQVFGPDADNFLTILTKGKPGTLCPTGENHELNPLAHNVNKDGSEDFGIGQINNYWQKIDNTNFLYDYDLNIRMAYNIFKHSGNFHLWTCGRVWGL